MELENDFKNELNENIDEKIEEKISKKYSKLFIKCEQIKMENLRLINYIDQINKLVKKVKKQNAFITNKLELNNDECLNKKTSIFHEIELVINYGKVKIKKENSIKKSSKVVVNDIRDEVNKKNKKIKLETQESSNFTLEQNII